MNDLIRVATYNVGWYRSPLDGDLRPLPEARDCVPDIDIRFNAFQTVFFSWLKKKNPDIVILQEVYEAKHGETLLSYFDSRGFEPIWPARQDTARMYPSGLFLAINRERLAIDTTEFLPFGNSLRGGEEKNLDNGLVWASLVSKTGRNLQFVGVHLQALTVDAAGNAVDAEEKMAHQAQMAFLKEQRDLRRSKGPLLLAGDINVGKNQNAKHYQQLLNALELQSAYYEAPKVSSPGMTWNTQNPLVVRGDYSIDPTDVLDQVLYDSAFSPERVEVIFTELLPEQTIPLSDHYGLMAELQW